MIDIEWICTECANKKGKYMSEKHLCTWHKDTCDVCGEEKMVTDPRDFSLRRQDND